MNETNLMLGKKETKEKVWGRSSGMCEGTQLLYKTQVLKEKSSFFGGQPGIQ